MIREASDVCPKAYEGSAVAYGSQPSVLPVRLPESVGDRLPGVQDATRLEHWGETIVQAVLVECVHPVHEILDGGEDAPVADHVEGGHGDSVAVALWRVACGSIVDDVIVVVVEV